MSNVFGWYYPAGAENDPNAPYNQVDPADVYHDKVVERIDERINEFDDSFVEFVVDTFTKDETMPDDYDEFVDWYNSHDKNWKDEVEEKYSSKFFHDILELVVEDNCEPEPDYERYDY